jgi:hypothetical protein
MAVSFNSSEIDTTHCTPDLQTIIWGIRLYSGTDSTCALLPVLIYGLDALSRRINESRSFVKEA